MAGRSTESPSDPPLAAERATALSQAQPTLRAAIEEAAPAVRRFLFGMCGDWHLAEDIAQGALLKAWARRESFDGRSEARTWIFAIARNHWLDMLRRHRVAKEEAMPEHLTPVDPAPSPAAQVAAKEAAVLVRAALGKLPPEQREVLALRESQGLTFVQIAQTLNIPTATAKSRARYALLRLAQELEPLGREWES